MIKKSIDPPKKRKDGVLELTFIFSYCIIYRNLMLLENINIHILKKSIIFECPRSTVFLTIAN